MVNFLSLTQKRGAFEIDESAKIWECSKDLNRVKKVIIFLCCNRK